MRKISSARRQSCVCRTRGFVRHALPLLLALSQAGCDVLTVHEIPSVPTQTRDGIRTVAVVGNPVPPTLTLEGFPKTKGSAAGQAAGRTYGECATAPGGGGGGDAFAALFYIFWLGAVCPTAAGVSAAYSAAATKPDEIAARTRTVEAVGRAKDVQAELAAHVAAAVATLSQPKLIGLAPRDESFAVSTGNYAPLASEGVDVVVEVGVTKFGTVRAGADDELVTRMTVHARLVQAKDNRELFAADYTYSGEAAKLSDLAADDGAMFRNAIENAYDRIGAQVADQFFLVHPFAYKGLNKSGWSWYAGLLAQSPGERAEVKTLQPTLCWEAFPRETDRKTAPEVMARVSGVAYDLMIAEGRTGRTVYARAGLAQQCHTVEQPLSAARLYFWTVRASFELDGRKYVTNWATLRGDNSETSQYAWYRLDVRPK